MIIIKNLTKKYNEEKVNEITAVNNVNLTINDGDYIAIMGPSGSGKSTLLHMIAGIETITCGNLIIDDLDLSNAKENKICELRNKNIGLVIQDFALVNDLSVYENVEMPLVIANEKRKTFKERISNVLKKMNISKYENTEVSRLSGGEAQRVAIARCLINNPKYILADEPTGALDRENCDKIMDIFDDINKEGKTIIIVTHDEKVAMRANKIIRIEDGKIINQ